MPTVMPTAKEDGRTDRFVCTRCYSYGHGRMFGIPGRSIGLFVLLVPIAWFLTGERLGAASVIVVPLWIAVFALPVAWFLLPSRIVCKVCHADALVPRDSPRGVEITRVIATASENRYAGTGSPQS